MTEEKKEEFINRIKAVQINDNAKYGRMNVNQMICHCGDQFRMMFGEFEGLIRQNVDIKKLMEMSARNETVPTPNGLDQVEGEGTKPTDVESDKQTLINLLNRYYDCDNDYEFSFHPYFGEMNKVKWERLLIHHLDHHLSQFGR